MVLTSIAVVTGIAQCVVDELADSLGGIPNRVCALVPGEIAWDNCECGMFAQTITGDVPSNTFPAPAVDARTGPCGPNLAVYSVTAQLVRCVPGANDNGISPSCDALLQAARVVEDDRVRLRTAITCCLREMHTAIEIYNFAVGATTSLGPQGLCGGVQITYQFALGNVCC